jgi:FkbM family methyltransferase
MNGRGGLSSAVTTIIDAGGRYGLHPTWKEFSGEMKYYLFEPDSREAKRLAEKYAQRSDEIVILDHALAESDVTVRINQLRNSAMSTSSVRNPVSSLFIGERSKEVEIINRVEVQGRSIDSFCSENDLEIDFLKLDTEGSEYEILLGAAEQLRLNILGLRVEVSFDLIFEGKKLFGSISDLLLENGYFLLNFDYNGRGDYQNEFVNVDRPYGILTSSDAVFLKRKQHILRPREDVSFSTEIRCLKYAGFCFLNNAPDVALDMLLFARRELGLDFDVLKDTKLYKFIDRSVHQNFYSLKWQPGQSLESHSKCYFEIFEKPMRVMHEFMESTDLNPT